MFCEHGNKLKPETDVVLWYYCCKLSSDSCWCVRLHGSAVNDVKKSTKVQAVLNSSSAKVKMLKMLKLKKSWTCADVVSSHWTKLSLILLLNCSSVCICLLADEWILLETQNVWGFVSLHTTFDLRSKHGSSSTFFLDLIVMYISQTFLSVTAPQSHRLAAVSLKKK